MLPLQGERWFWTFLYPRRCRWAMLYKAFSLFQTVPICWDCVGDILHFKKSIRCVIALTDGKWLKTIYIPAQWQRLGWKNAQSDFYALKGKNTLYTTAFFNKITFLPKALPLGYVIQGFQPIPSV